MDSAFTIRFAEPRDSENFVKWATENPNIDSRDIADSLKENNPTCVVLVAEKNGVPILFAPFYCAVMLAYLGFNPDWLDARDRITALEAMRRAMNAFARMHGIMEINTLTTSDQMVAKWAEHHGFRRETRQLYRHRAEASDVL